MRYTTNHFTDIFKLKFGNQILLIIIWFCFSISGKTAFGQNANNKDFPVLSKNYNVDKNPVDFIIVVDQSATVKKYWEPIKASASKLVSLANDGDYLTLIGFKETVDNLIIARKINSSSKRDIIDEIKGLGEPKGSYTDLYESVDFTLEKGINRPEGNRLQIIFYFTDFKNDPAPQSKWRTASTDVLNEKRKNYIDKTGKLVNIFAFQLPLEAGAGRDYEQFSEIFDNKVKRIISDPNTMQEWFGRLSQEISREKLRLLLQNDLNNFLTIEDISVKGDQINIDVHNKLGFPVNVDQASLNSDNSMLNLSQSFKNILIPANGNSIITLSIAEFLKKHESLLEKRTGITNSQFSFKCSFTDLESEFGKLNVATLQIQTVAYDKTIIVSMGIPYWIIGISAIALMLLIYFIYKFWIKPEWTFNRKGFKITTSLDGKLLPNSTRIFEKSKKPVIIDYTIISASDVNSDLVKIISESIFKIYVVPARPSFLSGKPKRGTYIFAESKGISFKIKKLVKGKVQYSSLPSNRKLFTERVFLHKGITIIGELNYGITKNQLEFNFYNK